MSCAASSSIASHFSSGSSSGGGPRQQQQGGHGDNDDDGTGAHPLPAPRSSSYMLMLNSFASDLDSILSDLSTSPPLRGSQDLAGLASVDSSVGESSNNHAASCPNLSHPPSITTSTEDATDSSNQSVGADQPITLLERLIRSHPVWYLPNVQRVAAAQLLQDQEQGVFITRQSSQPGTLALSVKLTTIPPVELQTAGSRLSTGGTVIGAGVQHYLIEAAENQQGVRLESSDFVFENLPALLAHYCQCCDELPVRLTLPARIRDCTSRSSLTSLALLGQEFWNRGDNILTIPSKRTPPVPPLRLSTFDPFGSGSVPATPTSTPGLLPLIQLTQQQQRTPEEAEEELRQQEEDQRKSPRLEARGTAPAPPPPPPRWCKPQLVQTHSAQLQDPPEGDSTLPLPEGTTTTAHPVERRPVMRRKRRRQRQRPSSSSAAAPESPHCHHSSLADKASDYEDIWNTSPGDSHDDEDEENDEGKGNGGGQEVLLLRLASAEDTALSERGSCSSDKPAGLVPSSRKRSGSISTSSSRSSSRSSSTAEKMTTASSSDVLGGVGGGDAGSPRGSSRSLTSSPERPLMDFEEPLDPPELFQAEKKDVVVSSNDKRRSITIVEIRHDEEEQQEEVAEDKENIPEETEGVVESPSIVPVRRRQSCSSNESGHNSRDNSRRTSPLYSEPADAIHPSQQQQQRTAWKQQPPHNRPLPQPPPPVLPPPSGPVTSTTTTPASMAMDFQTFTKDGYVRCTLPPLTASTKSGQPRMSILPQSGNSNSAGLSASNNKGKQVSMPKPPRQLPRTIASTATLPSVPSGGKAGAALPAMSSSSSVFYLPTATEDNSLTIQEVLTALYPMAAAALTNQPPPSRTPTPPNSISPVRNSSSSQLAGISKQRVSAYDNLLSGSAGDLDEEDEVEEEEAIGRSAGGGGGADDDGDLSDDGTVTEFSEPWDSARWDRLLSASPAGSVSMGRPRKQRPLLPGTNTTTTSTLNSKTASTDAGIGTLSDSEKTLKTATATASVVVTGRPPPVPNQQQLLRTRSFKDKMDPVLAAPRLLALRSACNSQAGKNLQVLVVQLGRDCTTTFGRSLQNFLQCTREAKEQRAAPVLRNVRQFISGIKNFLVQHGEPAFDSALLDIRSKLKSNEFLNVDAVLELVLHQLVTLPLRSHLYKLLGQEAMAAGSVQQLLAGIRVAREIHPSSLGLKEGQPPPSSDVLARASASLDRLQKAASPLDKLEQLLEACAVIYNHAAEAVGEAVAAEDFLPLLAWLLAHCGFSTAEMEADFMWALLQPSLLAGEGGYFLTALSSAAQLLKNLQSRSRPASPSDCGSWMGTLTSIPECAASSSSSSGGTSQQQQQQPCVLRVLVADENQSSLLARTVPLRPSMTARDVTKLLALKLRLSNPQDFTLVALVDGQEIQVPDTENPLTWMSSGACCNAAGHLNSSSSSLSPTNGGGRSNSPTPGCTFAFRRQDAKIAWPRQINA